MTLLVGVLCTDGVVIGSDSAATLGSGVLQSPVKKVYVVNDSILVATAGSVGLGQRFRHVVAQAADDEEFQAMDLVGKGSVYLNEDCRISNGPVPMRGRQVRWCQSAMGRNRIQLALLNFLLVDFRRVSSAKESGLRRLDPVLQSLGPCWHWYVTHSGQIHIHQSLTEFSPLHLY